MGTTGTIFEIRRFAIHDGPGIRTTVFFKGCPLDCWWCHNPEGRCPEIETFPVNERKDGGHSGGRPSQARIGRRATADEVMAEVMRDGIFYDQSGGGVTFSGGEPLLQTGFLYSLLKASRDIGLHTACDTSGYAPTEDIESIYDLVDLFLFDLKLIDCGEHQKYIGVSNELILSNLTVLATRGNKVVIRIPLVPGITDTAENLNGIVAFIEPLTSIRAISLLPYNKFGEDKVSRYQLPRRLLDLTPQSADEMETKAAVFRSRGYDVRIGG